MPYSRVKRRYSSGMAQPVAEYSALAFNPLYAKTAEKRYRPINLIGVAASGCPVGAIRSQDYETATSTENAADLLRVVWGMLGSPGEIAIRHRAWPGVALEHIAVFGDTRITVYNHTYTGGDLRMCISLGDFHERLFPCDGLAFDPNDLCATEVVERAGMMMRAWERHKDASLDYMTAANILSSLYGAGTRNLSTDESPLWLEGTDTLLGAEGIACADVRPTLTALNKAIDAMLAPVIDRNMCPLRVQATIGDPWKQTAARQFLEAVGGAA